MKVEYTTIPARFIVDYIIFRRQIWNMLYNDASTTPVFKTEEDCRLLKEEVRNEQ